MPPVEKDDAPRTSSTLDSCPVAAEGEQSSPLATTVAGIPLSKCLLNSSNPFATSIDDLQSLAGSPATGAFATRTACPNFVHDEAQHKWHAFDSSTINCLGYSCHDFDYYVAAIQKMNSDKPAFLSVSGYANEVADMLEQTAISLSEDHQVLIEINLSCPNIPNKPPVAYDFDAMKEYLTTVFAKGGNYNLKVGVKLTPYFYDTQFVEAAAVLNEIAELSFVTCINTVGCGLVVDVETDAPAVPATHGGLGGGPAIHALAVGNVRRLRQLLHPRLDIIGCGGVNSGKAAYSHLLCGASAVMVASALLTEGVGVFERIEEELLEIMAKKEYTSVSNDVCGKLRNGAEGITCPTKK